jgi:N-acetylglucosamine-6-phosphate deacetylase
VRVGVESGRVVALEDVSPRSEGAGIERWILPGFFDIQVNGFAGRDFTSPGVSVEDVVHVAEAERETGVTRFLPTIITADLGVMCRQLSVIAEAMDQHERVRGMCPGMHVEGPFIHPEDGPRGAHPREYVRRPDIDEFERLWEASAGRILLLTLAPDGPGAIELIRHAVKRGVTVALGHHRADEATLEAAIQAGARLCTHLGNGCDATMPRHDNYVWYQLGEDRLWASLIADGHHLPPATLRCMLRAKTPDRTVLITDAVGAAGMPPGTYLLGVTEVERMESGKVVLPGTPYQAGSGADMPGVIARAVKDGRVPFIEAVRMATLQPAALLYPDERWTCEPGAPANLVEVDWDTGAAELKVRQVVTAW